MLWVRQAARSGDRTSESAFAMVVERADTETASAFLEALLAAVSHTILTDNLIQLADLSKNRNGVTPSLQHLPFDRACKVRGIEHRVTRPNLPPLGSADGVPFGGSDRRPPGLRWANCQALRLNRMIKNTTVKRYHCDHPEQLRQHLETVLHADDLARRPKGLDSLTSYDFICRCWTRQPRRFSRDPIGQCRAGPPSGLFAT